MAADSGDGWEPQSRVGKIIFYWWGFSIAGTILFVAVTLVLKIVGSLLGLALDIAETFSAAIIIGVVGYLVVTHGRRAGK